MAKVIISISGGNLQAVHSDIPGVDVEVFDWDNIRSEREDMDEDQADTFLESREDEYNQAISSLQEIV